MRRGWSHWNRREFEWVSMVTIGTGEETYRFVIEGGLSYLCDICALTM